MVHLLIGSTCNISGLMTKCLKFMENCKMYKNKAIGICKTREDFFGAYISDIISLWLYFWSYIQNFSI